MYTKTISVMGLVGVALGVVILIFRSHYMGSPAATDPRMQLAPYHEGMNLREVFETFPEYGAGPAKLRLLQDNTLAWSARWKLLDQARRTIDVSYFILKQDVFGVSFLGHLLKKAEQGVKIRILLDGYGSRLSRRPAGNDYIDTLLNTGNVEVRLYRPLLNRAIEGLVNMSLAVTVASEHDKILVVDGEYAITGGRNIATEYFAHPDEAEMVFRDLGVEVADREIATALRSAFEQQYLSDNAQPEPGENLDLKSQRRELLLAYQAMHSWLLGRELSQTVAGEIKGNDLGWVDELEQITSLKGSLTRPLAPYVEAQTRVLDSTTRYKAPDDVITQAATRLVKSAREEIFIQNPYVVVADEAIEVFATASQHDVPILLFTNSPESAKSAVSQAFFLEQWPRLLAGVPTLRLYANAREEMIHAKLATFDGVLSLVGTYNLSPLSMATNSEVVLAIWSSEIAGALTRKPRAELASGPPQVYRYRIARNADGKPQLDADGNPIVKFGPQHHMELDDHNKLQLTRKLFKAVQALPGVSPFF